MKKIYIVGGGGGFARMLYLYSQRLNVEFGGFLGHDGYGSSADYGKFQSFYKGEVSEHKFTDNEYAVIGAGYPKIRKKIFYDLKEQNINLYNFIVNCCDFEVREQDIEGEGNIIIGSYLHDSEIVIGNGNLLLGVDVGHSSKIGNFNFIGGRTQILGNVKIGDSNTIGTACILLPKCKIGNNNNISPLSCVYKGCKDNTILLGNPAQKIGEVS